MIQKIKWLGFFLFVAALGACGKNSTEKPTPSEATTSNVEVATPKPQAQVSEPAFDNADTITLFTELDKQIKSAGQVLPLKIDDATSLIKAGRQGQAVLYTYKVNSRLKAEEVPAVTTKLKEQARRAICAEPSYLRLLQVGFSFGYSYEFTDQKPIGFTINKSDCGN